jgi:hypothetical protein
MRIPLWSFRICNSASFSDRLMGCSAKFRKGVAKGSREIA